MRSKTLLTSFVVVAAILALQPELASAQCAMCRTALEQNGGQIAAGFNRGIMFLLGMPYLVFGAIGGSWAWKRRRAAVEENSP